MNPPIFQVAFCSACSCKRMCLSSFSSGFHLGLGILIQELTQQLNQLIKGWNMFSEIYQSIQGCPVYPSQLTISLFYKHGELSNDRRPKSTASTVVPKDLHCGLDQLALIQTKHKASQCYMLDSFECVDQHLLLGIPIHSYFIKIYSYGQRAAALAYHTGYFELYNRNG